MRNIVIVSLLFFLLPFSEVEGQEKDTAIVRDKYARPSERGDLELLVRRVYEAFLVYTTGYTMEFKVNPRPIGRKYERVEKITTPPEEKSLPLILGFDKEKNEYIPTG